MELDMVVVIMREGFREGGKGGVVKPWLVGADVRRGFVAFLVGWS